MKCDTPVYLDYDHMVIPIFYDVESSEVRRQEGVFGREMESYADMHREANMAAWQAALGEAVNRSGWHLNKSKLTNCPSKD
ncbi:hypothetical protein CDL15_Pgr018544 [Punica granatum]|nr:hypothetical protein CDL15_Pgr018544 [Punica granatum]